MSKGSNRRPENREAIEKNWPFSRQARMGLASQCDEGGGPCEHRDYCNQHGCYWSVENTRRWYEGTLPPRP